MTISEISQYRRCTKVWRGVRTGIMRLCIITILLPLSRAHSMYASTAFDVTGSQFHQRDPEDAGEARICIRNTGPDSLSMAQLKVRILAKKAAYPNTPTTECRYVYAKLSPPVLRPGQYGEILAKLLERPTKGFHLTCAISTGNGAVSYVVRLAQSPLWISFVGFSEDLRRAFIYVENPGRKSIEAELLKVGDFDVAHRTKTAYFPVPPGDKRCLIGNLPSALSVGEFVHVVIAVNTSGRESKVHAVTRVINAFPLVLEHGTGDPQLGLDLVRPFLRMMACPSHKYGTPDAAAAMFLDDYVQQFTVNPSRAIQMTICRSNMPRSWLRFGDLPDVAAMNPCLRPPSYYDKEPEKWFCPFSCLGDLAKRATEPGRFLAIIPTGPDIDEQPFLLKGLTSQESRFMLYCAVASGAKGVIYRHRGQLVSDPLSRDTFRQMNRELHHLKPLLSIAEPVEWITTEESNYVAKSLLCGDQAILVIVFDSRYFSRQKDGRFYTPPFGRAVIPVRLNCQIPHGITVQEVTTPFSSLDRNNWDFRNGVLELTADMVGSTQVYIIHIKPRTHPKEGELSR
ncbi:MAG: hypothetical protein GY845_31465 [Planctomycetes bacterium]|nr:hypothetical protein [Planctomycetota bacterium]